MAEALFNSISLFDEACRERIEQPEARFHAESMPGIDGQFVQLFGWGARKIIAEGLMTAQGTTAIEAAQALKAAIRQKQTMVSAWFLAEYVGTDQAVYQGCLLTQFRAASDVQIEKLASDSFRAFVQARAEIIQFAP